MKKAIPQLTVLACVATLLGGCMAAKQKQQVLLPLTTQPNIDAGPIVDAFGYHRGYAADNPTLTLVTPEARYSKAIYRESAPWYQNRKDFGPTASAGYRTTIREQATNVTHDRTLGYRDAVRRYHYNSNRLTQRFEVVR